MTKTSKTDSHLTHWYRENKDVGLPYCRAEMYAGRVAWWVTVSMPTGQPDGRQTVTLRFPSDAASVIILA